jgi:hypothetical protein
MASVVNQQDVDDINEELERGLGFREDADEEDNLDNTEQQKNYDPIVKEYLRWMRRHVSHIEAIKILCKMGRQVAVELEQPFLSIKVLAVPHQGSRASPWRDVVMEIWKKGPLQTTTAADVIDKLCERSPFKDAKEQLPFRGTLHCEACLISLLRTGQLDDHVSASCLLFNTTG